MRIADREWGGGEGKEKGEDREGEKNFGMLGKEALPLRKKFVDQLIS